MNDINYSKKSIYKSLAIFSFVFLAISTFTYFSFDNFSYKKRVEECVIENFTLSQMISAAGEPVRWIKVIDRSFVRDINHCLELPSNASDIKISVVSKDLFSIDNKKNKY